MVIGRDQFVLRHIFEPLFGGIINQTYVKTTKKQDFVDLAVCWFVVDLALLCCITLMVDKHVCNVYFCQNL